MVGTAIIVYEYGLVAAHGTVGTETAQIGEFSGRGVTDGYSGCTGWDPNQAELAVADSIMGEWKTIGNPCTGTDADKTFYAQSTYVQKVMGKKDMYIALFDRWNKKDLENSRYVWLPFSFEGDKITIP